MGGNHIITNKDTYYETYIPKYLDNKYKCNICNGGIIRSERYDTCDHLFCVCSKVYVTYECPNCVDIMCRDCSLNTAEKHFKNKLLCSACFSCNKCEICNDDNGTYYLENNRRKKMLCENCESQYLCRKCYLIEWFNENPNPSDETKMYKLCREVGDVGKVENLKWIFILYINTCKCGFKFTCEKIKDVCESCMKEEFVKNNPDPSTNIKIYKIVKVRNSDEYRWVLDYCINKCVLCYRQFNLKNKCNICIGCGKYNPYIKLLKDNTIKIKFLSSKKHSWKKDYNLITQYDYYCKCGSCIPWP